MASSEHPRPTQHTQPLDQAGYVVVSFSYRPYAHRWDHLPHLITKPCDEATAEAICQFMCERERTSAPHAAPTMYFVRMAFEVMDARELPTVSPLSHPALPDGLPQIEDDDEL